MCHIVQQEEVGQNCTQHSKNWLVMHNKDHGVTIMNRHVVSKHFVVNIYKTNELLLL